MILAEELFERFKLANQEKYGHISEKELKAACTSQFDLVKQEMESGNLIEIRLQYLFTIRASKYRVIKHLKGTYRGYLKGFIKDEDFTKYALMFLNHIQQNPRKFRKYEEVIKEATGFTKQEIANKTYLTNLIKTI